MKKTRVFDPAEDLPKERTSLLTISNKFGLTFVGLHKTFKVYLTQDILSDKFDGNANEIGMNMTIQVLILICIQSVLHNIVIIFFCPFVSLTFPSNFPLGSSRGDSSIGGG